MPLKIDFKSLFFKLCKELDKLAKSDQAHDKQLHETLLAQVLEGTEHKGLLEFHGDLAIDIVTKTSRYTNALTYLHIKDAGSFPDEMFDKEESRDTKSDNFYYKNKIAELNNELAQRKLEYENLAKLASERRVEEIRVLFPDKSTALKEEYFHKQLPEIIDLVSSRNAFGWPEQLYIWGAAGAGKTHMTYQIGRALGFDESRIYTYPMGPTVTESKLLGFNNFANGKYVEGWLYNAFKNGGLVALDEGDLADAQVFASANSMDNSYYIFGNGEVVKRHKDFYLIVWANTIGTGSTRGYQRNVLDAATRDRFTFYELLYDEEMERKIYGHEEWAKLVQVIRQYVVDHMEGSFYVTPRATRKGFAYRKHPVEKLLDWLVFKGCSRSVKDPILADSNVQRAIAQFKKATGEDKREMGSMIGGKRCTKVFDQTWIASH